MRGFYGRHRVDKPQASLVVDSYDTALYPPRAYHCLTVERGSVADPNTVMLPSIDSDSVCKPFIKDAQSPNLAQHKPTLLEYFSCFVSPSMRNSSSVHYVRGLEALNVLHYSELWQTSQGAAFSPLAKIIPDLVPLSISLKPLDSVHKISIRHVPRAKPPKPTRRGAKVTLEEVTPLTEGGKMQLGVKRSRKQLEEGMKGNGDNDSTLGLEGESDHDDDVSVTYVADDDDDGCSDGFDDGENDLVV